MRAVLLLLLLTACYPTPEPRFKIGHLVEIKGTAYYGAIVSRTCSSHCTYGVMLADYKTVGDRDLILVLDEDKLKER